MHFDRSKVEGEFLRVTISRNDSDDKLTWRLHFGVEQSVLLTRWLLENLPPAAVLMLIARTMQGRPEIRAVVEAAGRAEDDNDGSQG